MTEEETNSVGRNCIFRHAPRKRKCCFFWWCVCDVDAAAGRLSPRKQWRRWLSLYQTHWDVCCVWQHPKCDVRKFGTRCSWFGGVGEARGEPWGLIIYTWCKVQDEKSCGERVVSSQPAKLFGPRKKSGVSPFRGYEIIISRRNWQYFWPNFNCTGARGASGSCCFLAWKCSTRREAEKLCLIFYNIMLGVLRAAGIWAFL
jgi:hypothetical protein